MIGLEYYTPTTEQLEKFGEFSLASRVNKIIYKKIDTNYFIYHTTCGKQGNVDEKTFKQIQTSHICPFCFGGIDSTTDKVQRGNRFCAIGVNNDETFGYYLKYEFELGKPMNIELEQVYYGSGSECYSKHLGFNLFATSLSYKTDDKHNDWKLSNRRCSRNSYGYRFDSYKYESLFHYPMDYTHIFKYSSKKSYLEDKAKIIEKSNQKKIAIDNLMSEAQMKFMVVFDLNRYEDIRKYNSYISANKTHINDLENIKLNIHYLDYLYRNKINLGTYFAYLRNLEELGFKYDKPKDFKYRSEKVLQMVKDKRDKDINDGITKRYNSLPSYTKDSFSIHPFKTADEIRRCGKELHNCISGYVSDYSKGKTDIYHLDVGGKMTVAIEVFNKRLKQAYEDGNKKCSSNLLAHIKTFCEKNGINLGNYA